MKKINISINEELLKRADAHAEENYITRSGLISISLKQYLATQEVFDLLRGINIAMRKIAELGSIDEETQKQLNHFSDICNSIYSVQE